MLLFDEADSLFAKRTEVKSAHDRYANLEVNYLLQRMETFDGVSVLTTNLESAIDPAFQRRLNFRIRFPEPEVDERARLWRQLLPPATGLARRRRLRGARRALRDDRRLHQERGRARRGDRRARTAAR